MGRPDRDYRRGCNGFDAAWDARFRATTEIEQRHTAKQIDLLWLHNHKRRAEIVAVQKQLTKEIEAIKSRINGAIWSFACAAVGAVVILLRPKLGL